jgi:hypothetical protein
MVPVPPLLIAEQVAVVQVSLITVILHIPEKLLKDLNALALRWDLVKGYNNLWLVYEVREIL